MTLPRRHAPAPDEPWLEEAVDPFFALGHPVRQFIVDLLAGEELLSGEIADRVRGAFGVKWSTVSHHLRVLHRAGFVRVRPANPARIYRLDDDAIGRLKAATRVVENRWARRRGQGFHTTIEPEEAVWPSVRAERRPRDADEALERILREDAEFRDTGAREIGGMADGLQQ